MISAKQYRYYQAIYKYIPVSHSSIPHSPSHNLSESARSDNAGEFHHDFFGFENNPSVNDNGFAVPDLAINTNASGISATNSQDEGNASGANAPGSPTSVYSSNSIALKQQQGAGQNVGGMSEVENG